VSRESLRCFFWWWMIPLLLVSFWLGARGLNADSMWGDELWSIRDAGGLYFGPRTLANIWENVAQHNAWHVPGFFTVLSAWGPLFGWQPPALRALALFFGMLAAAMTYRLGRDLVSPKVGLYAAVVLGTSVFFVHYLHELRMYTLMVLVAAYTLWIYLRVVTIKREPGLLLWLGLLAGTLASMYTHYFSALPLAGVGLYHLLLVRKNARWWRVMGVFALTLLAFVPWVPVLLGIIGVAGLPRESLGTVDIIGKLLFVFGNSSVVLAGAAVLCGLAAWRMGAGARRIWFLTLAILGVILLSNPFVQVVTAPRFRYIIVLWPLMALIIGMGIAQLERLRLGATASVVGLAVWVGVAITNRSSPALLAELDGIENSIFPINFVADGTRPYLQPGDLVVNYLPDDLHNRVYRQYRALNQFYFYNLPGDQMVTTTENYVGQANEERQSRLNEIEGRQRVWLAWMPAYASPSLADFESSLAESYHQCAVGSERSGVRVDQYTPSPVCCINEQSRAAARLRFGDGITLSDIDLPSEANGDTLQVWALWGLAASVPPHEYSASFQLIDSAGNKVAQGDYGLEPLAYTCQQTKLPITGLPPGEYRLDVLVYAWRTGERLPGVVTATGEAGDTLTLGTVAITS
jgi:hypothetical protein